MSQIITRKPHVEETAKLHSIWENVFGNIGKDAFFRHLYDPGLCIIAQERSAAAAAGYLLPFSDLFCGKDSIPCAMIYSVATLPQHRGKGLATAIVEKLIKLARELNYPAVVICPSDDGLFEYYSRRTEFYDWFYTGEQVIKKTSANTIRDKTRSRAITNDSFAQNNTAAPPLTEITPNEYNNLREFLLSDIVHIKHNIRLLEYQSALCDELGGGFFRTGDSCAIVEYQQDGTVWIKELLTPDSKNAVENSENISDIVLSISEKFPANEYIVRYPAQKGRGRRFGMLTLSGSLRPDLEKNNTAPWYGMAFD